MNTFRQYIPGFVDVNPPEDQSFNSLEELLALEKVSNWKMKGFSHFAIRSCQGQHSLIAVFGKNAEEPWRGRTCCVGYLAHLDGIDLPTWE